jgi:hypothetical protein
MTEKKFEIEFFNTLLDSALMLIKEKFESLHQQAETLGFLYNISELAKNKSLQNTVQIFSWLWPLVPMQISNEFLYMMNYLAIKVLRRSLKILRHYIF